MVLDMPGFGFDQVAAEALARTLRPTLAAAIEEGTTLPTVLAALALSAAAVAQGSALRRGPGRAAQAVAHLMQLAMAMERTPW